MDVGRDGLKSADICYAQTLLPTEYGDFHLKVYRLEDGLEHVALVKGDVSDASGVLLRIHSECLTGEVFGSLKCDCKRQLDLALQAVARSERGVVLYLRQEGRGIGLGNKILAYQLQEQGLDTVDANRVLGFPDDVRDFSCAVRMLRHLGVVSVRLMTNNPHKVDALVDAGIHVVERVPHVTTVHKCAEAYLKVKGDRMGHFLQGTKRDDKEFEILALDGRY